MNSSPPDTPASLLADATDVVLIVDDVPDNLAVLHDALDEAGYTVLVATDGPGAIARAHPLVVDTADAGDWLAERLAVDAPEGVATVVFHSIVWQYLPAATKDAVRAALHDAGARADGDRPLHWLRMEPATREHADLRLTTWGRGAADGEDELLVVERLGEIVGGPEPERLEDDLLVRRGRQHDHRQLGALLPDLRQHRDAVHVRQPHVEHDDRDGRIGRVLEGLRAVHRADRLVRRPVRLALAGHPP